MDLLCFVLACHVAAHSTSIADAICVGIVTQMTSPKYGDARGRELAALLLVG
jgi:hypothetical protein